MEDNPTYQSVADRIVSIRRKKGITVSEKNYHPAQLEYMNKEKLLNHL